MDERPFSTELATPWSQAPRPIPRRVIRPIQRFMETEIAGGVVLVIAAAVALVWANSPARESYEALWETEIVLRVADFVLAEDLRHWVNDLLMALFFFVVGLEIKREFVAGELRDPRAAMLPVLAALGGMIVPAGLYFALNAGGPGAHGWGIPMATDIAFAVGVLALVGTRAPLGLKVFLLTLAVADDIGAIAVIAVFYSKGVNPAWLGLAAVTIVAVLVLRHWQVRSLIPYIVLAAVLWLAVFESGVHATIAGVVLGLLTPALPFYKPEVAGEVVTEQLQGLHGAGLNHEEEEQVLLEVSRLAHETMSPLARLEARLAPWAAFVVLPIFALANAGVELSGAAMRGALGHPVTLGVALGLVLGKPVGVLIFTWLAVRFAGARLPAGVGWVEITGAGLLAGIGFTVAIFVAGLAFADPVLADAAKVGILAGSMIAALVGAGFLAARDAAAHHG